jgi:hypothetical protein
MIETISQNEHRIYVNTYAILCKGLEYPWVSVDAVVGMSWNQSPVDSEGQQYFAKALISQDLPELERKYLTPVHSSLSHGKEKYPPASPSEDRRKMLCVSDWWKGKVIIVKYTPNVLFSLTKACLQGTCFLQSLATLCLTNV